MTLSRVWSDITGVASANGASRVGAADLADPNAPLFDEWIDRGHHATMRYLAKNRAARLDPYSRFPWAKSERPHAPEHALSHHVARYALGDDYHDVLDRILRELESVITHVAPEAKTWRYVDTGPLSDRALAAAAGLGWIGKNGMLIDEERGSYSFIGTLLTSLANDISAASVADRCGACTRCIDACPTDAILPNRTVASERCISYLTIEHRGPIDQPLDGNVFGCDICQEVCPWNAQPAEPHPAFVARDEYRATPVSDLLRFEQSDFSRLFRKSAIKRAKLEGMKRNVALVIPSVSEGPGDL
jgi:epoxyqueuosine reductase